MNQFLNIVQESYNAVFVWAEFAFSPVQGVSILLNDADPKQIRQNTSKIWIVSIALSIVVVLPILRIFDIGWQNADFLLCYVTILLIVHILCVYAVHLGLCMSGVKSNIVETAAIYTMLFIYLPVVSLANLPNTYQIYFSIREIKRAGLTMGDAIQRYFALIEAFKSQKILYFLGEFTNALVFAGMLFAMVAFTEAICSWYGHPRHRTYLVVSASIFVGIAVAAVVAFPTLMLILYSYIK